MDDEKMVTKTQIGVLLLVILSVSIYIQMDEQVKLSVDKYKSVFSVWEDDKWVISGTEYSRLFDGSKLSYADKREVTSEINGSKVTIKRVIEYKNGATQVNTYTFDGSIDDKELFPIEHKIEMFNAKDKILEYTARELQYTGESRIAESPESFGHNMKIEWEGDPYIHKIYKYKGKDEGKLTLKWRVNSDYEVYYVRLFDPVTDYTYKREMYVSSNYQSTIPYIINGTGLYLDGATNQIMWAIAGNESLLGYDDSTNYAVFDSGGTTQQNMTNETSTVESSYGNLWDGMNQLKARWDLNNNANDSTSNNHDGTVTGASYNALGTFGGAYSFDGTDDSIAFTDIDLPTEGTVSAWVNITDDNLNPIIEKRYSTNNDYYVNYYLWYYQVDDSIHWTIGTGSAFYCDSQVISDPVAQNTWYHIVGVFNSTGCYLYINGLLNKSSTATGTVYTHNDVLNFGVDKSSSSYFKGVIDEVRIYNRTLTANEILAEYNSATISSLGIEESAAANTAPTITLNSPVDDYVSSSKIVTFNYTPIDDSGFTNCSVWSNYTGQYFSVLASNATSITNNSANLITGTYTNDGIYLWWVECYDNGNPSLSNVSATNRTVNISSLDSETTIYLNGTDADRYFELGDQINITAVGNVTGNTMCISIDHPNFGDNYICDENQTNANITIYPILTDFSDGDSSNNLSADGFINITLHKKSEILQGQIQLTGYLSGASYTEEYLDDSTTGYEFNETLSDEGNAVDSNWATSAYNTDTSKKSVLFYENVSYDIFRNITNVSYTIRAGCTGPYTAYTNISAYNHTSSSYEDINDKAGVSYFNTTGYLPSFSEFLSDGIIQFRTQIYCNIQTSPANNMIILESATNYEYTTERYPRNVSFDIGNDGTLDYWFPYSELRGTSAIANKFKTNKYTLDLTFESGGSNVSYIDLPCGVSSNQLNITVTGSSGVQTMSLIDNEDSSKNYSFSTANVPQEFELYIPADATIQAANITISGEAYYDFTGTQDGDPGFASSSFGDCSYFTSSSDYLNGTPTLEAKFYCSGPAAGTTTLTLVGASAGTIDSCTVYHGYGVTSAGGWLQPSCNLSLSSLTSPDTLHVTASDSGDCHVLYWSIDNNYCATRYTDLNQYEQHYPDNVTVYFNTSSQYLEYNYTLEMNSSVGDDVIELNTTNIENAVTGCAQNPCPVSYYVNSIDDMGVVNIKDVSVKYISGVSNLTLDIGNDGTDDFSISGSDIQSELVSINLSGLSALDSYMEGTCLTRSVPLVWRSETAGSLNVKSLEYNYSVNPILLNTTAITTYMSGYSGDVEIPVKYYSDYFGILGVDALRVPFYGDINYTVSANYTGDSVDNSSSTQLISIIWSNYTIGYPTGTSYFQFFPKNNNDKNVTPYKQTTTVPMFNITGTQRDRPFNIYIRVNASYPSDTNLTASNISTKSSLIVTTTWQKITDNLTVDSSQGIWFWRDYFNAAARWINWHVEIRSVCDICVQ